MKHKTSSFLTAALAVTILFSACKKNDTPPENDEELITTVQLTFTETGTSSSKVFTFKDADGPGGNAPTLNEQIVLSPNKQYECEVKLLSESVSPAENITEEVEEEANDHQFYYTPAGVNITVSNLNNDPSGKPFGLKSRWTTGVAGTSAGTVKFTLKHKPGIKGASDAVSVGETDIEIDFSAIIK